MEQGEKGLIAFLLAMNLKSRSVTRIWTGWMSRQRLPRQRFRIILRSVQPNSRVLEMPEIRYSKRFEYLRVSSRVTLPRCYTNIQPCDCWMERVWNMAQVAMRVSCRPFLWSLKDLEAIEVNVVKLKWFFKGVLLNYLSFWRILWR